MNCPSCGAAMEPVGNRRYFRCTHCTSFEFPEEIADGVSPLGEPAGIDCPVCAKPLQTAAVDGEPVSYCERCRGFLAALDSFGRILVKRRALHGHNEQVVEPFNPEELKRRLACPACHKAMDPHAFCGGGNAVVDTCEHCNLIWLDAGELAVIERFVPHEHRIEPTIPLAQPRFGTDVPILTLEDLI